MRFALFTLFLLAGGAFARPADKDIKTIVHETLLQLENLIKETQTKFDDLIKNNDISPIEKMALEAIEALLGGLEKEIEKIDKLVTKVSVSEGPLDVLKQELVVLEDVIKDVEERLQAVLEKGNLEPLAKLAVNVLNTVLRTAEQQIENIETLLGGDKLSPPSELKDILIQEIKALDHLILYAEEKVEDVLKNTGLSQIAKTGLELLKTLFQQLDVLVQDLEKTVEDSIPKKVADDDVVALLKEALERLNGAIENVVQAVKKVLEDGSIDSVLQKALQVFQGVLTQVENAVKEVEKLIFGNVGAADDNDDIKKQIKALLDQVLEQAKQLDLSIQQYMNSKELSVIERLTLKGISTLIEGAEAAIEEIEKKLFGIASEDIKDLIIKELKAFEQFIIDTEAQIEQLLQRDSLSEVEKFALNAFETLLRQIEVAVEEVKKIIGGNGLGDDLIDEIVKLIQAGIDEGEKALKNLENKVDEILKRDDLSDVEKRVLNSFKKILENVETNAEEARKEVAEVAKKGKQALIDYLKKAEAELKKTEKDVDELLNTKGLLNVEKIVLEAFEKVVKVAEQKVEDLIKRLDGKVVGDIIEDVVKLIQAGIDEGEKALKLVEDKVDEILKRDDLDDVEKRVLNSFKTILGRVESEAEEARKEVAEVAKKGKDALIEYLKKAEAELKKTEKDVDELLHTKGLLNVEKVVLEAFERVVKVAERRVESFIKKLEGKVVGDIIEDAIKLIKDALDEGEKALKAVEAKIDELSKRKDLDDVQKRALQTFKNIVQDAEKNVEEAKKDVEDIAKKGKEAVVDFLKKGLEKLKKTEKDVTELLKTEGLLNIEKILLTGFEKVVQAAEAEVEAIIKKINGKIVGDILDDVVKAIKAAIDGGEKALKAVENRVDELLKKDDLEKRVLTTFKKIIQDAEENTEEAKKDLDDVVKNGKQGVIDFLKKGVEKLKKTEADVDELLKTKDLLNVEKVLLEAFNKVVKAAEKQVKELIKKLEGEVVGDIIDDAVKAIEKGIDKAEQSLQALEHNVDEILKRDDLSDVERKVLNNFKELLQKVETTAEASKKEVAEAAKKGKKAFVEYLKKGQKQLQDLEKQIDNLLKTKGITEVEKVVLEAFAAIAKGADKDLDDLIKQLDKDVVGDIVDDVVKVIEAAIDETEKVVETVEKKVEELLKRDDLDDVQKRVLNTFDNLLKDLNDDLQEAKKEVETIAKDGKQALVDYLKKGEERLKKLEKNVDDLVNTKGLLNIEKIVLEAFEKVVKGVEKQVEDIIKKLEA